MPVVNRIADLCRRTWPSGAAICTRHPELGLECHETAAFVAEQLREFGVDEMHEGIARTGGIVAIIRGQGAGPVTGLRADMDALPMTRRRGPSGPRLPRPDACLRP